MLVRKLILSEDDHFYDLLTYHIGYRNLKTNSASDEVGVQDGSSQRMDPHPLSQADAPECTSPSDLAIPLVRGKSCMISLAFSSQRGILRESIIVEQLKGTVL